MSKTKLTAQAELKRLRRKHGAIDTIEFLIADVNGMLRGKQVQPHEFSKTLTDGFVMPGGTVLLDAIGAVIDGLAWSSHDGDPDINARFVPGSLAPVPWAQRPAAQALFRFYTANDRPFIADPRYVLERTLERLKRICPTVVMAAELEFYLLRADSDRPTARVPLVPGIGRPQPGPQVYTPDDLAEVEGFLNELHDVCSAQGLPAGTTTAEYAPGQYEINLHHVADPVLACDHAVLLKRAVKAVARKHGMVACFMAKPFAEESGSGLHLHVSCYDRNGKNYFSRGRKTLVAPPFSTRLRHAIGGLQQTMAEATAIFAPNANSYRRLRPDSFAPIEPNWGTNHRNVSLRIPVCDAKNLRFEHRAAGADANPYLVTAAVLAGLHHGLRNKIEPGRMTEEGEVIRLKRRIPNRWSSALDRFSRSKVMRDYLGDEFCELYIAHRRSEERRFHNEVSDRDYDWYLRGV